MPKVVLDTNAIIYAVENKIDIFSLLKGWDIIIPNLVISELQKISKAARKASDRKAAFIALKIIEQASFRLVELSGATDKAIKDFAKASGAAVLTNDALLRKSLKASKIKVLTIRQKKLVESA